MRKFLSGIVNNPRFSEAAAERAELSLPTSMPSPEASFQVDNSNQIMTKLFPEVVDPIPADMYTNVLEVNGLAFRHIILCHQKAGYAKSAEEHMRFERKTESALAWKESLKMEEARKVAQNLIHLFINSLVEGPYGQLYQVLLGEAQLFNFVVSPQTDVLSDSTISILQGNYDLAVQQKRVQPFIPSGKNSINTPDGGKHK